MNDGRPLEPGVDEPYGPDLAREQECWTEISAICRALAPAEREQPGYFRDPDWTVKDMVAHLGTWMAQAEVQLLQIEARTYVDEPLDIDGLNARFLAAMRDQSWSTVWGQAISARAQMLAVWGRLRERTEPADRWVRKAGAEHGMQHLPRLRSWVAEMHGAPASNS